MLLHTHEADPSPPTSRTVGTRCPFAPSAARTLQSHGPRCTASVCLPQQGRWGAHPAADRDTKQPLTRLPHPHNCLRAHRAGASTAIKERWTRGPHLPVVAFRTLQAFAGTHARRWRTATTRARRAPAPRHFTFFFRWYATIPPFSIFDTLACAGGALDKGAVSLGATARTTEQSTKNPRGLTFVADTTPRANKHG